MAAPKTYRALATLYVDERFIREGEVFTSASPKGSAWEEIKPKGGSPAPASAGTDD